VERLSPGSSTFVKHLTSAGFERANAGAVLAPSGRLVLVGGEVLNSSGAPVGTATVVGYDPTDGGLPSFANLPEYAVRPRATVRPDGQYLVTGGSGLNGAISNVYSFDPELNMWSTLTPLVHRDGHTATLLPSNRVRLVGGADIAPGTNVSDFDEGRGMPPAWVPHITSVTSPATVGGEVSLVGTGFMGGPWAVNGSSYTNGAPVPVVTLERLDGSFRVPVVGHGWTPTTLGFTVPALPSGWYLVRVTVNGLVSEGAPFFVGVAPPAFDAGIDAGVDSGVVVNDAGTDAGTEDAGTTDAGELDAGTTDAGTTDAGTTDAGTTDAGTTDGGVTPEPPGGFYGCLCGASGRGDASVAFFGFALLGLAVRRRRQVPLARASSLGVLVLLVAFAPLAARAGAPPPPAPKGKKTTTSTTPAPTPAATPPAPTPAAPPPAPAKPEPAASADDGRIHVAVLPLDCGPGVKKEMAEVITDSIASELAKRPNLAITTSRDVAAKLGYQRQAQLLGTGTSCSDNSLNCMIEIGNALGVDKLAFGSVARVGESAVLNITVLQLRGADVARHTERVKNLSEDAFLDAIPLAVQALFPVGGGPATGQGLTGLVASAEANAEAGGDGLDGTMLNLTVRGQLSPLRLPAGAWVAHVDYAFSESFSAGVGAIVAKPFGAFARGTWVPFNAHGQLRPLVALEVPVLFSSAGTAVGVGGAVGVEYRLFRNLAIGLEVPVSYYFGGPADAQRFWLFGAVTVSGRL
jgi:MYXO-CTERM domain-containing protein